VNHLIVVGTRPGPNPRPHLGEMNTVAALVERGTDIKVVRCEDPTKLPEILRDACAEFFGGEPIDLLETYDHASVRSQWLGSGVLFEYAANKPNSVEGYDIARQCRDHLRKDAQIRLLGCHLIIDQEDPTGEYASRVLLVRLAEAFGESRVVYGTNTKIDQRSFTQNGLHRWLPDMALFSSQAAFDSAPATYERRGSNLNEMIS